MTTINGPKEPPALPKCEKCGRTRELHGGICFECACLTAQRDGGATLDANRLHAAWLKLAAPAPEGPSETDEPEHFDS